MILDRAHLRSCLSYAHARFQSRDGDHGVVSSARVENQWIVLRDRHIDIRFIQKLKTRRKNSNDRVIYASQDHRLAERLETPRKTVLP